MKYIGKYFLLAGCLWPWLVCQLRAQVSYLAPGNALVSPPPSSPDSGQPDDSILTIKKRVDEVNVLFIATDKHGKFVRNLNQNDFAILDDHKPPQSIVNFRRETDLPIELGLLIDTSGSVRGRFDFEQEAAVSFLQNTMRPNFDKAFVVGFNGHSQMMQDFTDNAALLAAGGAPVAERRRHGALRCHLSRLPRQSDQGSRRPSFAAGDRRGERWRGQSERVQRGAGH